MTIPNLFFFSLFLFLEINVDGRFDSEYFQQTEESNQFRQEYDMRKKRQASFFFFFVIIPFFFN